MNHSEAIPFVVLQSVRAIRSTTNPYIAELIHGLSEAVPVKLFSWRRALVGRWDLLHIHWPELVFVRPSRSRTFLHSIALLLLFVRLRITGAPLVRTVHNVVPHEDHSLLTRLLLRAIDRRTTLWIRLNPETVVPPGARAVTIPHPHYRDWFAGAQSVQPSLGRVGFFGQVRDYKNVDTLIRAFAGVDRVDATLAVAGQAHDPRLAGTLRVLARDDTRVSLRLEHVPDAELAEFITRSQLIVLPYRELHNSGALLLALSLGRPVLVPDNVVTRELESEVGPGWVHRFEGELGADAIGAALGASTSQPASPPDLRAREWPAVIEAHLAAFNDTLER